LSRIDEHGACEGIAGAIDIVMLSYAQPELPSNRRHKVPSVVSYSSLDPGRNVDMPKDGVVV
jgi:hypothetical protein